MWFNTRWARIRWRRRRRAPCCASSTTRRSSPTARRWAIDSASDSAWRAHNYPAGAQGDSWQWSFPGMLALLTGLRVARAHLLSAAPRVALGPGGCWQDARLVAEARLRDAPTSARARRRRRPWLGGRQRVPHSAADGDRARRRRSRVQLHRGLSPRSTSLKRDCEHARVVLPSHALQPSDFRVTADLSCTIWLPLWRRRPFLVTSRRDC